MLRPVHEVVDATVGLGLRLRRGLGTALLAARHRDLDRSGVPAYLKATSPRARDLYLRHGYTMRPGSAFRLPEGPLLWPMCREPAGAGDAGDGRG